MDSSALWPLFCRYPLAISVGGPQSRSGWSCYAGDRTTFLRRTACSLITVSTKLSQVHFFKTCNRIICNNLLTFVEVSGLEAGLKLILSKKMTLAEQVQLVYCIKEMVFLGLVQRNNYVDTTVS